MFQPNKKTLYINFQKQVGFDMTMYKTNPRKSSGVAFDKRCLKSKRLYQTYH